MIRPRGLSPDLRAGRPVVHLGIHRIDVLIGEDCAGCLPNDLLRLGPIMIRVLRGDRGGGHDDFGTVGLEHAHLFLGHLVGHGEHAAITLDRSSHGEPDAGVAAGGLDDGAAGLEPTGCLSRLDDRDADPILHRAARVLVLRFAVNRRADAGPDPGQADERGPPDGIEH